MKWDTWQRQLIEHKGSVSARCGRQTGKSTAVGKRAADNMINYTGCSMLMTAPAQRQSAELFMKMRGWLDKVHDEAIEKAGGYKTNPKLSYAKNMELKRQFEYDYGIYNELPTKTTVILKKDFSKPMDRTNRGSVCVSLPAGRTGVYLRFLSLDFLYIDEAAFVPEVVYNTLRPMLAISAKEKGLGWECLLSTPFGKGGFFYDSQMSKDFKQFHISAEDCKRYDKVFLRKEQLRMTKAMYAQEYLAEFVEEWNQFFPTKLIKKCMTFIEWNKKENGLAGASYYLGQDLARYGGDEIAYVIVEEKNRKLKAVKTISRERVSTTATVGETGVLQDVWHFKRIFTDSGGLGGAVLDQLQEKLGKRRVIGLDNSSKGVQVKGEEKRNKILKEDLYSHTLMLMEIGHLELKNDLNLLKSLKSITFEYTSDKNIKIFGNYTHLTEALVRACWCLKDRGLDLYVY